MNSADAARYIANLPFAQRAVLQDKGLVARIDVDEKTTFLMTDLGWEVSQQAFECPPDS
jgi:hypothetical protein